MSSTGTEWTPYNTTTIISNIKQILESGNINLLNNSAYKFLINHDYDIAHYDIEGFKSFYDKSVSKLADAIINQENWIERRYNDNWFKNTYGEDYENSIYVIGTAILNLAKEHSPELHTNEKLIKKVDELILADKIARKYGLKLTKKEEPSQN